MNESTSDAPRPTSSASDRSLTRRHFWQLGTAAALGTGAAVLLPGQATGATEARSRTSQYYFDRAARLAGDNPILTDLVAGLAAGFSIPFPPAPAPLKIFDDVAVVSIGFVSATAILTSDGIILIDALTSPADVQQTLVPGLRALALDPSTIKYVVVCHAHGDHFGGAQYLADTYGTRVLMAPADWEMIAANRPANAPTRDLDITDGQRLTLGNTTVTLHHTPGHTPGSVSPIFPVRWHGKAHRAMLWGGTNPPAATADKQTYLASALAFASRMRRAGVDVELSNHGFCDHGLARIEEVRASPDSRDNPFVVGTSGAQRFMKVMENMLRGRILLDQESTATATATAATPAAACGC
ncbi:MBL fold metallo-hydrolase [Streptomyces sp. TRM68416]|uniref:MBL fold metallo-hydrolase n=1 Tax=Streptomyces sp. TRM68416 TaxID=2758412 RepID=UPI002948C099|nr:MBL fold metallo-hydrolase [Streptomyces sp. TRM68416]